MNNNPAAWHARMPPHNNTTVPKWNESRLRELPQYFKELEYLFADCGITDDTQKKEYALQYVSYNTAEGEWKSAVLRLYPGTDASACYNLGDLEWLVNQTFNSGLVTLGRFSDYYRDFQCIARWLLTNGKLYCNEEHRLFQQGIPTSLWSKIICHLKITLSDHHPEDPYDVDQVFKGAKWVLEGTDTSMTKTSNGTSGIPLSLPIANAPAAPSPTLKRETLELTTITAIVSTLECLEALLTNGNAQPCQQFANSTCHFCGEIGHTMVQGMCMKLEQMIQQGKVHQNAEEKIILPSGTMIPNYFGNKEERIEALKRELFALRRPGKKFDGVQVPRAAYQPANNIPKATPPTSDTSVTSSSSSLTSAPAAKPVDKGKASERTVINEQLPIAKEPVAQPPIHLFSGIPGHYVPPANRNFAASNQTHNSAYQTMLPIYNIEQSKAVFKQVLNTKVTVLVGKLCSVSQDIRNQFRTAVMPK
ncbi:hypothetical protein C0989_007409 [Termitomyces sp. Mn162]|nr:hypothetical protein C0989_007409 [Termitomyces sp. Mn162]